METGFRRGAERGTVGGDIVRRPRTGWEILRDAGLYLITGMGICLLALAVVITVVFRPFW